VTPELVRAHAELDVLASHVHLPVQSGSNRVLKRMLRRYTRELYLDRLRALASARPGVTFSTDVIVGFPGETEEDFEETLSLVREAGFVAAFGFAYSPRPHTPSLRLADDVSDEEKSSRLARFFDAVAIEQRRHLGSLVGRRVHVLVEGPSRGDERRFTGRSERHEIVHLLAPAGEDPTGRIVEATVERANDHSLLASMDGAVAGPMPRVRLALAHAEGSS
jgi:tRNA-2-methylthio-N6-dimethylallyladenosine synthase